MLSFYSLNISYVLIYQQQRFEYLRSVICEHTTSGADLLWLGFALVGICFGWKNFIIVA